MKAQATSDAVKGGQSASREGQCKRKDLLIKLQRAIEGYNMCKHTRQHQSSAEPPERNDASRKFERQDRFFCVFARRRICVDWRYSNA